MFGVERLRQSLNWCDGTISNPERGGLVGLQKLKLQHISTPITWRGERHKAALVQLRYDWLDILDQWLNDLSNCLTGVVTRF